MASTSLKFYVNKQKLNAKKGTLPIYCRLINNKNKKEFRLPKTFDLKASEVYLWNLMSQRLNFRNHPTNEHLNALEFKFQKLLTYSPDMTLEEIIDAIQDINSKKNVEPAMIDYIDQYLLEEIETPIRKEGTKKNYRNAFKQFKEYLKFKKIEKIKLKEFSFKEASNFKLYLEKELEPHEKKNVLAKKVANSVVSSSTKIKNIKPVFKKAYQQGLITIHPFENIKLCHISEKSPCLTMQEIKKIYDLNLSHIPTLDLVKDIFLFMVYTGLSITDTLTLCTNTIKEVNNGRYLLDTTRTKTSMQVRQVIIKPAEMIIKKYHKCWTNRYSEKIFPTISDVDVNRKLKIIAPYAGIQIVLKTKTARITCREQIYEANISETLVTDVYMGWSPSTKQKVILQYLAVTENKLLRFASELEIHYHNVLIVNILIQNEVISRANALTW